MPQVGAGPSVLAGRGVTVRPAGGTVPSLPLALTLTLVLSSEVQTGGLVPARTLETLVDVCTDDEDTCSEYTC